MDHNTKIPDSFSDLSAKKTQNKNFVNEFCQVLQLYVKNTKSQCIDFL